MHESLFVDSTLDAEEVHQLENGGKKKRPKDVVLNQNSPEIFFEDGTTRIDFVLVWKSDDAGLLAHKVTKRTLFEQNLEDDGLLLEYSDNKDLQLRFVKIHAPYNVLLRYAEILKMKMPMKESPRRLATKTTFSLKIKGTTIEVPTAMGMFKNFGSLAQKLAWFSKLDEEKFPPHSKSFTAVYSMDKEYLFEMSEDFFTPSKRSRIVDFILRRKRFSTDPEDVYAFGIQNLLIDNTYVASYPLHDGDMDNPGNARHLLATEWATLYKFYKQQPLDYIKDYFGVKIALYFAWLGFYTYMLIPASVVGLICFIYGCLTVYQNAPSEDICNSSLNITMCPLCDHVCDMWDLTETCAYARISYLFDNPATVFFAVFMSFWSALFLENWMRYSAEISHRWDLVGSDITEEHPRPEYLARLSAVKKKRLNYVTKMWEPYVSFWKKKVPYFLCSFGVVLLLVAMALVAVMGVILYRMSVLTALSLQGNSFINSYATFFTTVTAACINLVCIIIFNQFYDRLAVKLTEWELPRTQTEFDDSLTLKIYLLQFVNYYASIFYIAFFKGRFIGYPGKYIRLFGYRQEECSPGGCFVELCIQLAIIMVGKQALNSVMEMLWPRFWKWLQWIQMGLRGTTITEEDGAKSRLIKDFRLVDFNSGSLFNEYLEMVLQFGFVTIFVAAFPLAPLFAAINNVFEMRLDAGKLISLHRRPVAQRVMDIGIWYDILESVGKLAVLSNAFIIAFTSSFIPRLVYSIEVSPDGKLKGFMNHSLAYFLVEDFPEAYRPTNPGNVSVCRYQNYMEPYWKEDKYRPTDMFWHVLAARLAFVVVFQNVVFGLINVLRWIIPDVPRKLAEEIRRENYLTQNLIIEQEALRAKSPTDRCTRRRSRMNEIHEQGTSDGPAVFARAESARRSTERDVTRDIGFSDEDPGGAYRWNPQSPDETTTEDSSSPSDETTSWLPLKPRRGVKPHHAEAPPDPPQAPGLGFEGLGGNPQV